MAAAAGKKIAVDLLIDRRTNRVVFAECGNDFADALISFLSIPVAAAIRLLSGNSSSSSFLGCTFNLYSTAGSLDSSFFISEPCRSMLLRPRSAAWLHRRRLAVDILAGDDSDDPEVFYRCRSWRPFAGGTCSLSAYPGGRCSCGGAVDTIVTVLSGAGAGDGGAFVKGATRFMVGDDLSVRPASIGDGLAIFEKLGIVGDGDDLEKITVSVGSDELLKLLERSLVSKTVLTDVFFVELDGSERLVTTTTKGGEILGIPRRRKPPPSPEEKKIKMKLFLSAETNKVVYAEAGEDMVDLLFSFLTFPLGSVVKLLEKKSSIGSLDTLYRSFELLCAGGDCLTADGRELLLSPKLPPHSGCRNQLLRVEEAAPPLYPVRFNGEMLEMTEANPRPQGGKGFLKESPAAAFMVTDEMAVAPLSAISGVRMAGKMGVPITCLEVADACIGETEALILLKACLTSRTPLSDTFSSFLALFDRNWSGQFPD